ncbi:1,4-alpha-glucan branching protein [Streptomyces sp. NPDC049555]|uniref:maltokinase N-terminal cap-like domain-containing protein n=1 Tax=Streptomyces sp. NPDC049555 TaxID=3154930 RepID=UPI00343386B5
MSVIHRTELKPTKLELLTGWLPSRPWYRGGAGAPELLKAGGFRLDDPEGEVGIEFMVVTDASAPDGPAGYLVPLTYRGAPLPDAGHALVGTLHHGVLGQRWVYDGCHDPVLTTQLLALVEGRVQAQAQSISDTLDHDVTRSFTGQDPAPAGFTTTAADDRDGTSVSTSYGASLRLHRVLQPGPEAPLPEGATGHVAGSWEAADGTRVRGVFAHLGPAGPQQ